MPSGKEMQWAHSTPWTHMGEHHMINYTMLYNYDETLLSWFNFDRQQQLNNITKMCSLKNIALEANSSTTYN